MVRDSILLSAHRLIRSMSTLFLTMILARTLTMEEMGIYQLILIITITIGALVPFEMSTSFMYFHNKTDDGKEKDRITANTFVSLFLLAVLTFLILYFGSTLGWFLSSEAMAPMVIWVGIWCFAIIAGSHLENLYVSTGKAKLFSIFSLIYYLVYAATAYLIISRDGELSSIVQFIAVFELVRLILLQGLYIKQQPFALRLDWALLKQQVIYTGSVGAVTAITVVNGYADKILVKFFSTLEEFAVFAIVSKEIPFVLTITAAVVAVMLSKLSHLYNVKKDVKRTLALWQDTSKILAVIIFPMFWILLFYNEAYISLIYSDTYLTGIPIFLIYLMKFPLGFTVFYTLLLISGKQKLVLINTGIVVGSNLVLSYIGILVFGPYGVAAATVSTAFIGAYLQQRDVCRVFGIRQKELLPYLMIARTFFVSGGIGFLVYYLTGFLPVHAYIRFFIGAGGVMAGTLAAACLLRDIPSGRLPVTWRRRRTA
ncbi:UNVERIFIED_CONTAM: oligosaccharide flippase family protein [Halobacillus marinus]